MDLPLLEQGPLCCATFPLHKAHLRQRGKISSAGEKDQSREKSSLRKQFPPSQILQGRGIAQDQLQSPRKSATGSPVKIQAFSQAQRQPESWS